MALDPDRLGPTHGPKGGVADSLDEVKAAFRVRGAEALIDGAPDHDRVPPRRSHYKASSAVWSRRGP